VLAFSYTLRICLLYKYWVVFLICAICHISYVGKCQPHAVGQVEKMPVLFTGDTRITLFTANSNAFESLKISLNKEQIFEITSNKVETFYFVIREVCCPRAPTVPWSVFFSVSTNTTLIPKSSFYIGDLNLSGVVSSNITSTRISFAVKKSLLKLAQENNGNFLISFVQQKSDATSIYPDGPVIISDIGFEVWRTTLNQ
jgi:hypothetical protein